VSTWRAALACAAAAVALLGACGGESEPDFKLDSSPRVADDEGVLTAASRQRVTLDGERSYEVSDELVSFSTYDRSVQPLLGFEKRYVQVGLRDDKVIWLAGIGAVVPGEPPRVFYTGSLRRVDKGRAYFVDGTVLRLADGLAAPPSGQKVQARIDVKTRRVAEFVGG